MTDTTDIKALRELLCHEDLESDYHIGVTVTTLRLLLSKADQLEVERQRTDKANLTCSDLLRTATDEAMRANKAEAEIAELKGDQVPVAYYANGGYYNTERAALKDGAEEVTPLFTTPQKPVVLPSLTIGEVMRRSGCDREYAE